MLFPTVCKGKGSRANVCMLPSQEAAQLSQAQRARLISLRAGLLQAVDRIISERRTIMNSIKASISATQSLVRECLVACTLI